LSTNLKRITFGIPSYNEEVNISNILHLIIGLNRESQSRNRNSSGHGNGEIDKKRSENKGLNFKEEFIIAEIIISDDSSDNTCRIVEAISAENLSVNIKLLHHNTRRGVSSAWNEIFKIATGDIIVLYDADIIIDRNTTANLVESIDNGIGLCASNSTPLLLEKSRISRASKFVAEWLSRVRNNGLSQYTVMGRALSISSHVAKSITIPENVIALDLYLQCKVLELGFKVVYNEQALV
jgi:glycosyltransferase involved in cell wall biosynthesis